MEASMKEISLNAHMGEAVLNRLRDFTALPEEGLVAGQAVASAVSELFGDGSAVAYNDIDVFRSSTIAERQARAERVPSPEGENRVQRAIRTCEFSTVQLEESYGESVCSAQKQYQVHRTARNGLLNDVVCSFFTSDTVGVLQTFDMNCVQVGVDLESKKLIWTRDFEQFNITKQLEIVRLHTPFHSLIRYFRKKAQLAGVYGNDERMIELVACAYQIARRDHGGNDNELKEYDDVRWRFGEAYQTKLAEVSGLIEPHFELRPEIINDYQVMHLSPRFEAGADLTTGRVWSLVHQLPQLSKALREKHARGTQSRLDYLATRSNKYRVTAAMWSFYGDDFVKGNVTPTQMAQIDSVVAEHSIAWHLTAKTLGEQLAKFHLIRDEVARRGKWVYGALETTRPQEWSKESLGKYLDEREVYLTKELSKPVFEGLKVMGYEVVELTSGMALIQEGEQLHHCVGGYAEAVDGGLSRIVSFRPKGSEAGRWFTVEYWNNGSAWRTLQVRGLQNRDTSEAEKLAADGYAACFNLAKVLGPWSTKLLYKASPDFVFKVGGGLGAIVTPRLWATAIKSKFKRLSNQLALKYNEGSARLSNEPQSLFADREIFKFWCTLISRRITAIGQQHELPVEFAGVGAELDDLDDIPF